MRGVNVQNVDPYRGACGLTLLVAMRLHFVSAEASLFFYVGVKRVLKCAIDVCIQILDKIEIPGGMNVQCLGVVFS